MKIGILQTGHAPEALVAEHGDYDAMFRRLLDGQGFVFKTFNVVDMEFPPNAQTCDGWLITGSKHGAYEDHPWIPPLEQLIREIYAAGRPLIGVCFGHQIIAQAMGGVVEKFAGGWSVGRTEYAFGAESLALNAWHQDQVIEPPAMAQTIASSDFCAHAALVYDDRIWTIQPHPEFGASFIDGLIQTRGKGIVPAPQLEAAAANLNEPVHNAQIATQMAAFLRQERAR